MKMTLNILTIWKMILIIILKINSILSFNNCMKLLRVKEVAIICDQVWENRSYPHIYFEKYEFELNIECTVLLLCHSTIQACQIYYINSAVI